MYRVTKRLEVSGAHSLELSYDSKCSNLHGHNWIITVTCEAEELNADGMVVDFTHIKETVMALDHANVNEVINREADHFINSTAENIAKWLCDRIEHCVKVEIQESEGNVAIYEV